MEEYGIGRPSTYAAILTTIQQRGYVTREKRRFAPTETGFLVNDLLVEYFPDVINVDFTAHMESELDEVAAGEMDWVALMQEFYGPFSRAIQAADAAMPKVEQVEYIGRSCPDCDDGQLINPLWDDMENSLGVRTFPNAGLLNHGWRKLMSSAPIVMMGEIVVKRTKRGRVFYGCSTWPACEFVSWKRPVAAPCPACGGLLVMENQRKAQCRVCRRDFDLEDIEEMTAEVIPCL